MTSLALHRPNEEQRNLPWQQLLGVIALAYLASPFDPPPGSNAALGHLDDLALLILGAALVSRSLASELAVAVARRRTRRRWRVRLARLIEAIRAAPKTLLFNFRYFPLRTAIRLPVVVRHTVHLKTMQGSVHLAAGWRTGGIKLGFGNVEAFDRERTRTVWCVRGRVALGTKVSIVHGARISVGPRGSLSLGDGVLLNAGTTIMCHREVRIGRNTRLAWDTLIMDSDFHMLLDAEGNRTNPDAAVTIGEGAWIGTRVTLLKGSTIADGCVVGAGSVVTRRHEESGTLIAGNPARVRRNRITWRG